MTAPDAGTVNQASLVWRPEPPGDGAAASAWPPLLVAEDLVALGVVAAFTSRAGGRSEPPFDTLNLGLRCGDELRTVLANRRRVLTVLGLAGRPLAAVRQVHGARVLVAGSTQLGDGPPEALPALGDADGLVTSEPGTSDQSPALLVLTADCVPILLADPAARVVAAVHAGWRGLAAGVVEAGVAALAEQGGDPAATVALVGPCIGPVGYEVGPDVRDQVAGRYPAAAAETPLGRPALDLAAAASAALAGAGVGDVRVAGERTDERPERWFSYRREPTTGRQAGIIALVRAAP
jgi:YfiH family protein